MFDTLTNAFTSVINNFKRQRSLTEASLIQHGLKIQNALIDADVPLDVARAFVNTMKDKLVGIRLQKHEDAGEIFMLHMKNTIIQFLSSSAQKLIYSFPETMLFIGLQGSGKTTTLSKLAYNIKQEFSSKKILLASVDYYRPSAIEQLEIGARNAGVHFYRSLKTDIAEAVKDILEHKKSKNYDVLLLDTAGRMHINTEMLNELRTIKSIAQPTHTIIVLDAMLGQTSMQVASEFNQEISFDGAIISKMDSDTRGGVLFTLSYILKKPIYFIGSGEHIEDLSLFHPERIADKIIGKGDIATLLEEAEKKLQKNPINTNITPDSFTLNDFADHIKMMNNLGPLSKVLSYMPAHMMPKISTDQMHQINNELKKSLAIIDSMTTKEKIKVGILDFSRKKRIAAGAGVGIEDIDSLCKKYKEMKQMMKMFGKI